MKYLRIKRIHFDAIRSGEKTTEYRARVPSYRWIESLRAGDEITLMCGSYRLTISVKTVRVIPTPPEFKESDFARGVAEMYAIDIQRVG